MKQTHFSHLLTVAVLVGLAAALSGCSTAFNPIGSNSYDCNRKQDPTSIYCHSFKAVENSTNGELPDSRFDTALKFSQYDKATEIAPVGSDKSHPAVKAGAGETVNIGSGSLPQLGGADITPQDGSPVRVGPVVLRTWIKSFVDGNDMRVSSTVVYKEVVPTHWAGFDGSDPASAEGGSYPHKTVEAKTVGAPKAQPELSQHTDFIQPGSQTSASESPGSSMPNSMPQ
jgi:hypothetical protein